MLSLIDGIYTKLFGSASEEVFNAIRREKVIKMKKQIIHNLRFYVTIACVMLATIAVLTTEVYGNSSLHAAIDVASEVPMQFGMRKANCWNCFGSGVKTCPGCYGSGKSLNGRTCGICLGGGRILCSGCGGTGKQP